MSEKEELEYLDNMLRRTATAVIYQCMKSSVAGDVGRPHIRHSWLIAKSVERIAESHGYWTPAQQTALLDMQSTMLDALRLLHGQDRGVPPEFKGLLFEDGTGRQYRVRRHDGESDAEYDKRAQSYAKVRMRFEDPADAFEQVVFIEQDRRLLLSKIADLQRRLDAAIAELAAAERYLDGGYKESDVAVLDGLKPRRERSLDHIVEYELQRAPGESDADFEARRSLFDNGGRLLIDVSDLPVEDVHEMNARRDLEVLFNSMTPEQRRRLIAAGNKIAGSKTKETK